MRRNGQTERLRGKDRDRGREEGRYREREEE